MVISAEMNYNSTAAAEFDPFRALDHDLDDVSGEFLESPEISVEINFKRMNFNVF